MFNNFYMVKTLGRAPVRQYDRPKIDVFLVLSVFFPNSTLTPKFLKKSTEVYMSTMNNHEFFQIFWSELVL